MSHKGVKAWFTPWFRGFMIKLSGLLLTLKINYYGFHWKCWKSNQVLHLKINKSITLKNEKTLVTLETVTNWRKGKNQTRWGFYLSLQVKQSGLDQRFSLFFKPIFLLQAVFTLWLSLWFQESRASWGTRSGTHPARFRSLAARAAAVTGRRVSVATTPR